MVDYPHRFAAVFFISGCTFTCGFCHNAELMGRRQAGLSLKALDAACDRFRDNWVNGAVITGGEPTTAPDLPVLIRRFKERCGFEVKLDTNGSNPERLAECLPLVDYVAMDIKCSLSTYPALAGFRETDRLVQSIKLIQTQAKDYEFRTTVIESIHTDEEMRAVRELVDRSRRFVLQPFIPRADLPGERFRTLPRTTSARLHELRNLMEGCAEELIVRGT